MVGTRRPRAGALLESGQRSSVSSRGIHECNPAPTNKTKADVLEEKVAANLVGPPSKLTHTSTNLHRPVVLPLSYSTQTLQIQTIEFSSDSRQFITQAALHEAQQDEACYSKDGRLLAVAMLPNIRKKNDEEPDDEVLILHVGGVHQNELAAVIPSAPEYTRYRSESAFSDYDLYRTRGKVTGGALRQHMREEDEQEAERGNRPNRRDDGPSDDLLSERFIMHTFPTKICSIEFGPPTPPYGHFHTGPWVCIRTISSTVFASIGVSTRKERLQGYPRLRLVALLEISHGDSLLPSGVTTRHSRSLLLPSERATAKRSKYPIVDARFHPERCTSAVTIDAKGNVGVFDCDLETVKESSWEKGVSWSIKQEIDTEGGKEESHWMIEWAEEQEMVVVSNRSIIRSLSLLDGVKKDIYESTDGSIIDMTCSTSSSYLLWVVTSENVLLFDLGREASFQALLSWEHYCSHSSQICLGSIETIDDASAVLLSNRRNRLLSLYSAMSSSSAGPATTNGEPSQLNSGLPSQHSYASAPVFVKMLDLHKTWHKWVRRSSPTKEGQPENDQLMIEMARDGSVWIRVVAWTTETMTPDSSHKIMEKHIPDHLQDNKSLQTNLPEIIAQRSLHSLGPVYRLLMSGLSADGMLDNGALSALLQASRWLQEQDMPLETMLLPHDLLAFGHNEESSVHAHGSALIQIPLLSMPMAVSTGVQSLLSQLLSSTESDAWSMDLSQLIEGHLCARVPTSATLDDVSEKLSTMYISQDNASRPRDAMVILANKLRNSCREIAWDLLLSSRVISLRPIVVQETSEADEERENTPALQAPPFSFSFFTPRLAMPSEKKSSHHQHIPTRKRIVTKSARWLLDEWKVGSDPKDYRFQHPYGDDHASETDAVTGSEDFSQSESEQQRSSRGQSRSVSAALGGQSQQDRAPSIPLPPTIGSASQPAFAARPSHPSRLVAQSQPVFASNRPAKPKKRRVGGF